MIKLLSAKVDELGLGPKRCVYLVCEGYAIVIEVIGKFVINI